MQKVAHAALPTQSNEAVVIAFALVFIVNTVLSALYTVIVPAVGEF